MLILKHLPLNWDGQILRNEVPEEQVRSPVGYTGSEMSGSLQVGKKELLKRFEHEVESVSIWAGKTGVQEMLYKAGAAWAMSKGWYILG